MVSTCHFLIMFVSYLSLASYLSVMLVEAASPPLVLSTPPSHAHAYATMMYCGTERDYEFYMATRVLFKRLQRFEVRADCVAIVSSTCPTSWIQAYRDDGVRVALVDDFSNPYKEQPEFSSRFLHTLNKLYAWSLTEYRRVVMLDADNIFLRNTDELFSCGDFCAVFINPCIFHTGLFVLQPSMDVFDSMVRKIGEAFSRDGADQGFLASYYPDLIDAPYFHPPANGTVLQGQWRLPFGYQMDASYFYFTLSWFSDKWKGSRCGANSVITFPSVPLFKPWFWWSWPLLPLGIQWHHQRYASVGYKQETPLMAAQLLLYLLLLLAAVGLRQRGPAGAKSAPLTWCRALQDRTGVPLCHPYMLKAAAILGVALAITIPYALVPTTVHPYMGWSLFFFGSWCCLACLALTCHLPLWPVFTPWIGLAISWLNVALPLYSHGFPRFLSVGVVAFLLGPFLLWAGNHITTSLDTLMEREPLMSRIL